MDGCEDALKAGRGLDWDLVSKAANLHYYRTYFEKDERQFVQANLAYGWITRALNLNPQHVDFTVKLADILGTMERYDEAVAVLERVERTPDAPAYVEQWLGYFFLFVDRLDDAIRCSEAYHRRFPNEFDSVFNIACAYAQKYCNELRLSGRTQHHDSENRRLALSRLKEALHAEPDFEETVRTKWTVPGESFDCFLHDRELRALVHLPEESATNA